MRIDLRLVAVGNLVGLGILYVAGIGPSEFMTGVFAGILTCAVLTWGRT